MSGKPAADRQNIPIYTDLYTAIRRYTFLYTAIQRYTLRYFSILVANIAVKIAVGGIKMFAAKKKTA